MQSVSKLFKSISGIYPTIWDKALIFSFFAILSIPFNKIVCGWACPASAMQELIYSIPILKNIKGKKLPFRWTNAVRIALFFLMIIFLFSKTVISKGRVLYHSVNIFNLFEMDFAETAIVVSIVVTTAFSVFTYRPFCRIICPFGLISWAFERISLFRVVVDEKKCVKCGKCGIACPSEAAGGYVDGKKLPADCFSCARCLNVCPTGAIEYKFGLKNLKRSQP